MHTGSQNLRVHDLVLLSAQASAAVAEQAICWGESWVADVLGEHPWVVVRRLAAESHEEVAVGVRGFDRQQRWAAVIPRSEILGVISPEDILAAEFDFPDKPAFQALSQIQESGLPVVFGPGGSVGYELVTGLPAVKDSSDLDLVLHAPIPLSDNDILAIDAAVTAAHSFTAVDVLIETDHGAVAFAELRRAVGLRPKPQLLLRTAHGPRFVTDPWGTL